MREKELLEFSAKIGVTFNDLALLNEALTHRSFLNENRSGPQSNNERMEFLGDAVLELIVSEHLFHAYTDHPEGDLTSFRAATVKTESLAEESRKIEAGKYLQMSKGEEATGGKDKDYLLANVYESILGAIYMDQGYEACKKFVEATLLPKITNIVENRLDIDSKTKFQEVAQRMYRITPTYKLITAEGPDHEKQFTMAVMVGKHEMGQGTGPSKQKAEESAATEALNKLDKMDKTTKIA
ncbi:MAG: ribonuclease III [Candidatus Dojkabacteria bacterium]|nr:MAG: ribonuclease III [Candidatus Dojkabacteria bacterium]